MFRRGIRRFLKNPDACLHPEDKTLADLIYGWGNESWSAWEEYLVCCVEHALSADGPILECGSGLSTLLIGAIAKKRGIEYWALEHSPEWAAKTQRNLDRYQIDSVRLCVKPIKSFGDYSWYDPPLESMPDKFALVVCDGPPGQTKGGRFGLVPVMRSRVESECVILLDDAEREEECVIARQWRSQLIIQSELLGNKKPFIKMNVLGPQPLQSKAGTQAVEQKPQSHVPEPAYSQTGVSSRF